MCNKRSPKDYYLAGQKLGSESISGRIFSFVMAFTLVMLFITPFIYGWGKELQVFEVFCSLCLVNFILCQKYLKDKE